MAVQMFTLTGLYQIPDLTPHEGIVEIIPSERVIKDTTGNVILTGRVKVKVDETGAFTVDLPDPRDTTLNPAGFGYTVAAKLRSSHPPAVSFGGDQIAAAIVGGVVNIEDVTGVDPSTFEPTATYAEASTVTALEARVAELESPSEYVYYG